MVTQRPERVAVFIDYENVHRTALKRFHPPGTHPARGHVDPLALARLVVSRRARESELSAVRVYRGRPSPDHQPGAAAANDRQAAHWLRDPLVQAFRRPLRYPPDWPATPATEKGVDVALAVDFVRLTVAKDHDVAIMVSRDTDLLPALETVVELRAGHVEVATWSGTNRLRFSGQNLPWCHYLAEADYRSVEDPTDYSRDTP